MTDPLQFAFSKERLILLALCAVFAGLLLFGAGVATGLLIHPAGTDAYISPPSRKATPTARTGTPTTTGNAEEKQTPEPSNAPQAGTEKLEDGLMVDVASFPQKNRASSLATMLRREGFGPVHVGQYDAQGLTLYYVRVGPFHAWEEASRVATELDNSFDLHSSVIPAKATS